ncbi:MULTISPECIES: SDR family oxidoreductase [Streptomyces]|uniref:SDR family NAD(P)-dependent oxidoreductase n=1 Tax=Streptomyces lycii TaxID=2654337 RepID=A0ABQ7FHT9_9ACTN|nr:MULTISPECIES: SDR family NAD(P)-dependent oxidoreductase [Streptomyces]KAF4408220.1 SDR family NAD(P)-dependent oxidoreductase [Streptomyces lycii]PGH46823.1 oxidoreductase [Streptomyces sp. Ru87]
MRIDGATVLLTGATGGIGRALAHQLSEAGACLVMTGRRADALEPLAAELGARYVTADLGERGDVARLADVCEDTDILVANAAVPASGDLLEYTVDQVDRALEVNLRAPVVLARLLAPRMVAVGRGHLAFVGSMSGKAATPLSSLYTASKFGLRGFAHSLRQDLRGAGVGVSLVQPGFVGEAGMFADTGAPVPGGLRTVSPEQVATAVVGAIRTGRAEVNIAPWKLRLNCALAGQFPGFTGRKQPEGEARNVAHRIVEAQRAAR